MPKHKITQEDIEEMKDLRAQDPKKWSYPKLAERYGTDHSTIMYNVKHRKKKPIKQGVPRKMFKASDPYIDPYEGKINQGKQNYDAYLGLKPNPKERAIKIMMRMEILNESNREILKQIQQVAEKNSAAEALLANAQAYKALINEMDDAINNYKKFTIN